MTGAAGANSYRSNGGPLQTGSSYTEIAKGVTGYNPFPVEYFREKVVEDTGYSYKLYYGGYRSTEYGSAVSKVGGYNTRG